MRTYEITCNLCSSDRRSIWCLPEHTKSYAKDEDWGVVSDDCECTNCSTDGHRMADLLLRYTLPAKLNLLVEKRSDLFKEWGFDTLEQCFFLSQTDYSFDKFNTAYDLYVFMLRTMCDEFELSDLIGYANDHDGRIGQCEVDTLRGNLEVRPLTNSALIDIFECVYM